MKRIVLILCCVLFTSLSFTQEDERKILRGKVLYRNSNVPNENVINSTSERATITNDNGEFAIRVKRDDELVFTSINYQIEIVKITQEILDRNRLVVEVNEKVTELDEVVISPENQKKFLELQNEDFKEFDYETDASAEVVNIAADPKLTGLQDGVNFVNIFKALFLSREKNDSDRDPLKLSEVLRQVYDDEFFVADLKIPADKIDDFLIFCDTQMPSQSLIKRDNEFQLIDFLVNQSEVYLKQMNAEE
ncbi:MAG: carboxypeptidase-like regulatory domain-containing protein [Flavobacteriaceae bacterium]